MTSRKIYGFLIRLHPSCFRKQYGDQMLWIFDESVQSRGAASLLFDAVVSLIRQWVLRSGYWRRARPALADGTNALAEMLHRNSEKRFRWAWRINMLYIVAAFVVVVIAPMSITVKFNTLAVFVSCVMLISGGKALRGHPARLRYISLFYYKSSREFYRSEIEARRNGLRAWVGKGPGPSAAGSIHFALLLLNFVWIIRPVILIYRGLPNSGIDWDHSRSFIYGFTILGFSRCFISTVNERAVRAIQQEIDAMDQSF